MRKGMIMSHEIIELPEHPFLFFYKIFVYISYNFHYSYFLIILEIPKKKIMLSLVITLNNNKSYQWIKEI